MKAGKFASHFSPINIEAWGADITLPTAATQPTHLSLDYQSRTLQQRLRRGISRGYTLVK